MSTVIGRGSVLVSTLVVLVLVGLSATGEDKSPPKKAGNGSANNAGGGKKQGDAKPTDAKPTDAKPTDAKPAPAKQTKDDAPAKPQPSPVAKKPTAAKSSPEVAALVQQIRQARSTLTAADVDQLAKSQATLKAAARRLENYLSDMGEERDNWKQYLHWDELQNELKKKSGFDVAVLAATHRRYTAGYNGLELPPFRDVARALDTFIAQAEAAQIKQFNAELGKTVDELAAAVETIGAGDPTPEQAATIGRAVDRLERYEQVPEVVEAVSRRYSQPNLLVDVAETFVTEGEQTQVDEVLPIVDCILGTSIRGTGHTLGTVSFDFIEDPHEAQIASWFQGTNYSRTVGTNRSALICSSGTTFLTGSQLLYVDEHGLRFDGISTSAVVRNQITGIGSTKRGLMGKIVKKIAAKKAPQGKAQAESIAAGRAKQKLADKMRSETNRIVKDVNHELGRRLWDPLERFGARPQHVALSTTDDALRIRVLQAGPSRFAAPTAAPKLPGEAGIGIRLHHSLVENSAAEILAGRKFDDARIRDLVETQMGWPLKQNEDETPFSITFADEDPISLSFEDGVVEVTVRGKGFTSEDKSYEGMNITARYKAESDGRGAKLVRQGDFVIVPPGFVSGRDKLALSQTALKRLLERRFEKLLKPEYVGEGLTLEDELSKLGTLFVSKLQLDNGWLTVGLNRRADGVASQGANSAVGGE